MPVIEITQRVCGFDHINRKITITNYSVCFADLDLCMEMIIFELFLTTFKVSFCETAGAVAKN